MMKIQKKLAMDIARLNKHNKNKKFLQFYSRFVNNKITTYDECVLIMNEYIMNKNKFEDKYGLCELIDIPSYLIDSYIDEQLLNNQYNYYNNAHHLISDLLNIVLHFV